MQPVWQTQLGLFIQNQSKTIEVTSLKDLHINNYILEQQHFKLLMTTLVNKSIVYIKVNELLLCYTQGLNYRIAIDRRQRCA